MQHFRIVGDKHIAFQNYESKFSGVVSALVNGSTYDVSCNYWPVEFEFVVPGLEFRATLTENNHPRYGRQYSAQRDIECLDLEYQLCLHAMRKKLTIALWNRLKVLARRFGDKVFLKLQEVDTAKIPVEALMGGKPKVTRDDVVALIGVHNQCKDAVRITKDFPPIDAQMALKYADLVSVEDVRENPYVLFWNKPEGRWGSKPLHVADAVAKNYLDVPMQPNNLRRLSAYFEAAVLEVQTSKNYETNGSYWFEKDVVKKAMLRLQSTDLADWMFDASTLDEMFEGVPEFIAARDGLYARPDNDRTEQILSKRLVSIHQRASPNMAGMQCLALFSRLADGDSSVVTKLDEVYTHWRSVYSEYAKCDELQRSTLRLLTEKRVLVLMGGAGTGKSMTLALIVNFMHEILQVPMVVCALTGKAVDRMRQLFGEKTIKCCTLHSQAFNPVPATALAIDEASMASPYLVNRVVTEDTSYLVICGDDKQLPSIEPGAFLRDVIAADVFSFVRLERVYRTGEGSGVATEAPKIFLDGDAQLPARPLDKNGFKINLDGGLDDAVSAFGRLVHQSNPNEVTMITNTNRTCKDANCKLQLICNPAAVDSYVPKLRRQDGEAPWVEGDRVIATSKIEIDISESQKIHIFNGMMGHIVSLDVPKQTFKVQFRDVVHEFPAGHKNIKHAYCVTTWKYQGSEIPHAIVFFESEWGLSSELFYTAVTRGQVSTTAFLTPNYLKIALATRVGPKRVTFLASRIKTAYNKRERDDEDEDEE
jgi:hypothetical protein